jgi:glycosyltransferase involved in cell wall biosynthesis
MAAEDHVKTTVVVPVWDAYAGPSLEAALQSLEEQEAGFHLLVVDNASTVPVPSPYGAEVLRAERRLSLGAARNLGLGRVRTPYVIFWDADDVMLPGALVALQHALDEDEELVAFGMAIEEFPSGERHRWPRRWIGRLVRTPRLLAVLHCVWSQFPTTGATIMRAEAARAGGGFAEADSGEDWCLGVSLAFRGRIGWSEQAGRIYLLHASSMWARHMSIAHQRRHAAAVRARLRDDPGVPAWAKTMLPVIALGQYAALAAHAVVAASRRRSSGSG